MMIEKNMSTRIPHSCLDVLYLNSSRCRTSEASVVIDLYCAIYRDDDGGL